MWNLANKVNVWGRSQKGPSLLFVVPSGVVFLKRFPQADKDDDGVLSIKELKAVIRQADVPKGKVCA